MKRRKTPADRAAGQEADRSKTALENVRQGYGHDRSAEDISQPPRRGPKPATTDEVARRRGERKR